MQINPYILEKSMLFSGIAANNFNAVLGCVGARIQAFAKGEYISLSSGQLRAVGLVLKGRVLLLKEDVYGNRNILNTLEIGEVFGESFVCGGAYTLTISIQAAEETEVLFLSFDRVMHVCPNACEFHNQLITNMVTMIARKNLSLLEKLEVTTRHSLREKILAYLSQLAQRQGNTTVTSPMGRMELADFLGVNRSALTRELSNMQDEEIIQYEKNTYTLVGVDLSHQ
ncbi:CRP-like cAMP-binding protein [Lachnospiraceae bacterium PF1-21]